MLADANPLRLMAIGFALLVAAWVVVFLMVLGEVPRSLLLMLGVYVASVAGLAIGMFGLVQYIRAGSVRRGPH